MLMKYATPFTLLVISIVNVNSIQSMVQERYTYTMMLLYNIDFNFLFT